MTMVKAIEFETYNFVIDNDGNRQMQEEKWIVPNSELAYFAVAEKTYVRGIHIERFFDFDFAKKARIPNWLPGTMAAIMIEDITTDTATMNEYLAIYETDMMNGYGTIDAVNEMFGDY